jgi:hypothetical protein
MTMFSPGAIWIPNMWSYSKLVPPKKCRILYVYLRLSSVVSLHHLAGHATFTRQPILLRSNVGAINRFPFKSGAQE